MRTTLIWRLLWILFSLSLAVLVLERSWNILAFSVTFVLGYGGIIFHFRSKIRSFFSKLKRLRFPVFIGLALLVSIFEEIYVYSLGNKIAVPDIWLDIIVVPLEWAAWFVTWYLLMARKFAFTESQVLLLAGFSGILFEYSGKGFLISDPLSMLVFFPTAIFVYATIFLLPMQLIQFSGRKDTWIKIPLGIFVPYLVSIPVGLLLYFTLLQWL